MRLLVLEVSEPSLVDVSIHYSLEILGAIVFFFAIVAGVRAWRKEIKEAREARDIAVIERADHARILSDIQKEFHPNGGSSLKDKIDDMGTSLSNHTTSAEGWFAENAKDHAEIKKCHEEQYKETNRRVDGIYEIMLGSSATTPRKTAQRHLNREEQNES